jgi:hypothetical protein
MPPRSKSPTTIKSEVEAPSKKSRKTAEPPRNIDTDWFKEVIVRSGLTQKATAEGIGVDQTLIKDMLNGNRKWNIPELLNFSKLFRVKFTEVVSRLGYPVPDTVSRIVGAIDANARVYPNTHRLGGVLSAPSEFEPDGVCAVFETAGTPLDAFNGTVVFWRETNKLEPGAVGRLSVVAIKGEPLPVVGILRHESREMCTVELYGLLGAKVSAPGASILWAAPILWTKVL